MRGFISPRRPVISAGARNFPSHFAVLLLREAYATADPPGTSSEAHFDQQWTLAGMKRICQIGPSNSTAEFTNIFGNVPIRACLSF